MFAVILVLFLVVPIVELYVIVQVADWRGVGETLVWLVLISIVGAWLVKREGLGILARINERLSAAEVPTKELADGALVLFAGALMLTPGFVTDATGLLLLFPPTRAVARTVLTAWLARRVTVVGPGASFGFGGPGFGGPGFGGPRGPGRGGVHDVWDVREEDDQPRRGPDDPPPAGELGP